MIFWGLTAHNRNIHAPLKVSVVFMRGDVISVIANKTLVV